ncbi:Hsp20/alpha crystallin family protein [Catenuloplanes japonicus]|uniref:Hsp20/alpha crystallin family protein n=1 Tax=Catenuloplanes japonicus TaxID=33876 RepID=UPI000525664D|nr:Hsp20/alpha crystallin family protein [Catenuloplanes japonicus]
MSNVLWTRRDPFTEFDALVRTAFGTTTATTGFTPAAEVFRDGEDAVVRLELPGVDVEKDVAVEVDGGRLTVSGERRDERTEGRSLREVRYGAFRRSFGLPSHVTSEAVSATYDAGVLSVRVAGAYAGREPRRIPVTPATRAAIEAAPAN